jgi:hypothetical protein
LRAGTVGRRGRLFNNWHIAVLFADAKSTLRSEDDEAFRVGFVIITFVEQKAVAARYHYNGSSFWSGRRHDCWKIKRQKH